MVFVWKGVEPHVGRRRWEAMGIFGRLGEIEGGDRRRVGRGRREGTAMLGRWADRVKRGDFSAVQLRSELWFGVWEFGGCERFVPSVGGHFLARTPLERVWVKELRSRGGFGRFGLTSGGFAL